MAEIIDFEEARRRLIKLQSSIRAADIRDEKLFEADLLCDIKIFMSYICSETMELLERMQY
jgi:hypothetical protein